MFFLNSEALRIRFLKSLTTLEFKWEWQLESIVVVVNHSLPMHAGWSKELLESLFDAVTDLRKELRLLGSDLIVLTGRTAEVLGPLAQKVSQTIDLITSITFENEQTPHLSNAVGIGMFHADKSKG